MATLSSVGLFSVFLSPSEVPGNGRRRFTSLLVLPPYPETILLPGISCAQVNKGKQREPQGGDLK